MNPHPCPTALTRRTALAGLATALVVLGHGRDAFGQSSGLGAEGPTWRAAPLKARLRPDGSQEAELWAFDGRLPGPVLRVRHGDEVRLRLVNETPKPLSLHWHGVRGPNAMDGVGGLTQEPVAPGASFEYRFTPPDAGTFLIRPCVLGGSAEPTERGLTALLIVDEAKPLTVDHDFALLIDDWHLDEAGGLVPFAEGAGNPAGRLGNWLSVNGKAVPDRIEVAPGSRVRLRLANACNARVMRLRFDGVKPYVIAVDGQPTDTFEPLKASLPFAPGSRYDLLIDMPTEAGPAGSVVAALGSGVPLVNLATAGAKRPALPAITPLARNEKLPPGIKLQNAVRGEAVISQGEAGGSRSPWLLNGKAGDKTMPPLLRVKRGVPVVLALNNKTALVQPMHLHGHAFRLLHPYDDGWDPYFLDTLQVPENKTVRIAFVADNPGRWLLASSVLERFDAGLWTWIEVA